MCALVVRLKWLCLYILSLQSLNLTCSSVHFEALYILQKLNTFDDLTMYMYKISIFPNTHTFNTKTYIHTCTQLLHTCSVILHRKMMKFCMEEEPNAIYRIYKMMQWSNSFCGNVPFWKLGHKCTLLGL